MRWELRGRPHHFTRKGRYNASLELALKIARYFWKTIEEVFIFEED